MMQLPTTVIALNGWIEQHFQKFFGPPRAYFELPFPAWIGFPDEQHTVQTIHRVPYLTLGFKGNEEDSCRCIAAWLARNVTLEQFQDATTPIFFRRYFDRSQTEETLTGRLAFWEPSLNKKLIAAPCHILPGALAVAPKMPEGDLILQGTF